jgi:hypothetical protein
MNVLCPFCQKPQTVPDSQAGLTAVCSNCQQSFPVPTLPQPLREPAALPVASAAGGASTPPKSTPVTDAGSEIFNIAMNSPAGESRPKVPPVVPPIPPKREKPEPAASPLPSREKLTAAAMPSANDYVHHYTLMIRAAAVALVAPIALLLVLVFWFFSWTGAYPGGHGVYTQSALQMAYGGHSFNAVGEKVYRLEQTLTEKVHWNPLMLLYVVVSLAALFFILAPLLPTSGRLHVPPFLERLWPWRWLIALALATIALLLLAVQSLYGFGLETAVAGVVQDQVAQLKLPSDTPEEQQILDINVGKLAGSLNLHRTFWWRLAAVAHLAAVLGLCSEWFLHRRTNPLPPRADFHW